MSYPACKHGWSNPNFDCAECQLELNQVPFERIKELERERDELRDELDRSTRANLYHFATGATLADENENLRAEVERLKADKARLDWMESELNGSFIELHHFKYASQLDGDPAKNYNPSEPYYVGSSWNENKGKSLREAIDAVMKGDAK